VNKIKKLFSVDWSFIGIIVFFIFHGYTENEKVVPFYALLPLLAQLLLIAFLLFFINRKLLGNNRKANVFTSIILIDVLYFGVAQDFLFQFEILSGITRLLVFVPLCLLLIVVFFIWLKKINKPLNKPVLYLNVLLVIYLLIDAGALVKTNFFSSKSANDELARYKLSVCDTCNKPPVYLLIFDSYFGSRGLKEFFHYDNSRFERLLADQGFHVIQSSHSNYCYTVFSMASLLNMQYLKDIGTPELSNRFGYNTAVSAIKNNVVTKFLSSQGYKVNNFSIFDIQDIPAGYSSGVLPEKVQLITSQTMYYRVNKWLPTFLSVNNLKKKKPTTGDPEKKFISNVNSFLEQTIAGHAKDNTPVFTYLHIMMPHFPFLLDSCGNKTDFLVKKDILPKDSIDNMFMQYEVYTNKIISAFITRLQNATAGKAVVLLMSDHGYQEAKGENEKLPFYNLNAIYLPQKNYQAWYDGISNVNQFRVLFNTLFHQQMPLLADSIITH
jgi:hypothetical protein